MNAIRNEDRPKDYSNLYADEIKPPVIPPIRTSMYARQALPVQRESYKTKVDGQCTINNRELFHQTLYKKLEKLKRDEQERNDDASACLKRHYNSNIVARRDRFEYKVYIQYHKFDALGDKKLHGETYVVRVDKNTLKHVKDKLPNYRPTFRYFFKDAQNTYLEVENDGADIPYLDRNGTRTVYCQVLMP